MPQLAACPRTDSIHYPDVLQFAVVWFLLAVTDIELCKIPPCMRRHLFEHTHQYGNFLHGPKSWIVKVENFAFTSGFVEFIMDNNVPFGSHLLLRHVGNFAFEVLTFDMEGFSLNLAGNPYRSIMDRTPPDPFFMVVESCLPDCSYRHMYEPPSFLYVPRQTARQTCEAFLRQCSTKKGRLIIHYGRDDAYMVIGKESFLHQVHQTFQLNRQSILAFFKYNEGTTRLLVLSQCHVEDPPSKGYTYDISSSACVNPFVHP
ncbi:unnamed protein product [Cuscuta epithymum]|uniref:Uncharacterized protein n=1 Tax=Cuscuta epithymum TaxID=186058 RepID=A0AAV0DEC9_9ASTE|nr:unnamed protein product [Cuscuta epithymum]